MPNITRTATHAWVDGSSPPLSASNLNQIESDMSAVFSQANTALATAVAAGGGGAALTNNGDGTWTSP